MADLADSNLIAGLTSHGDIDASIDIITRSGEVLQTLVSKADYSYLGGPYDLRRSERYLYLSDWTSYSLLRVDLETREVSTILGDKDVDEFDLPGTLVVDFDNSGNLYFRIICLVPWLWTLTTVETCTLERMESCVSSNRTFSSHASFVSVPMDDGDYSASTPVKVLGCFLTGCA